MRRLAMLLLGLLVLSLGLAGALFPLQAGGNQGKPIIRVEDFQKSNVIGKLGVPLGQVVVIEADAVHDGPQSKPRAGTLSLKISSVNQRPLDTPAVFLDEHILNDASQPVGLTEGLYRLAVYESGRFTGIPRGDEKYRGVHAGRSFYFQSELCIVHNFAEKTAVRQK